MRLIAREDTLLCSVGNDDMRERRLGHCLILILLPIHSLTMIPLFMPIFIHPNSSVAVPLCFSVRKNVLPSLQLNNLM